MRVGDNDSGSCSSLLSRPRVLVIAALLAALSIVLGKYLAFNITQAIRISFENLPILIAGILFGPLIGALVGVVADLVGCVLVGYAINLIITFGAAVIGALSGFAFKRMPVSRMPVKLIISVAAAHIIGSMIIKSVGIYIYYNYPIPVILLRIPTYIAISAAEFSIIHLLLKNRGFMRQMEVL